MRKLIGVVGAACVSAGVACAEPTAMTGEVLRTAVAGKTVYLSTPVGDLPIIYRANGTMSAQSRLLAQYTGTERDSGTWWVSRDKLCQRWSNWLERETHCYTMRRQGNTVHWSRDDGRTGVATIAN